jgi:hypothetical protein
MEACMVWSCAMHWQYRVSGKWILALHLNPQLILLTHALYGTLWISLMHALAKATWTGWPRIGFAKVSKYLVIFQLIVQHFMCSGKRSKNTQNEVDSKKKKLICTHTSKNRRHSAIMILCVCRYLWVTSRTAITWCSLLDQSTDTDTHTKKECGGTGVKKRQCIHKGHK